MEQAGAELDLGAIRYKLEGLNRVQLQREAKKMGVPANQKTSTLVNEIVARRSASGTT